MGDLTVHFSVREFACRHCGRTPDRRVLRHLAGHLERLRAIVGRPLVIRSGYRCVVHNSRVGGAPKSRHVVGDAVDLVDGYATEEQAEAAGFMGIGTRGGWATHVDLRAEPARWSYD